jgi:hypothetical protein
VAELRKTTKAIVRIAGGSLRVSSHSLSYLILTIISYGITYILLRFKYVHGTGKNYLRF